MNFTAVWPARRTVAVVTLTAVFASLFFLVVQNQGDARSKPVRAAVAITTKDQKSLLRARGLVVRVRAAGRTTVRVTAGANFRGARVSFGRRGSRVVKLRLTARGSKALGSCGTRAVSVRWSSRAVGAPSSAGVRSKRLRADRSRCVTVPLGANPTRCDFLDTTECLYPFANDYFTRPDKTTETGKRLNISADSTPANTVVPAKDSRHIATTDINRGDGFSPGNMIVLKIPGLDTPAAFQNSGLVPITDTGAYADPDQSVIVIDAETGERHPIWAELDSNPTTVDPVKNGPDGGINTNPGNTDEVNLIVRAAKNYEYGHRYIVAFRNLKDADNQPIDAPLAFRVYRDGLGTLQPIVEKRRAHMNSVISTVVNKAGVNRKSLYMAWDFTVASEKSITGRALQIRDDAFSRLGDINLADRNINGDSPDFSIVNVCDQYLPSGGPTCGGEIDQPGPGSDVRRVVEGRLLNVPCYLNQNGCPAGATFDIKANGDVDFDPSYTATVPFRCIVPDSIQPGGTGTVTPGRAGIYGHGLLGDYSQVWSAGPVNVAREAGSVWCAVSWDGFSAADLLTVVNSLKDMSNFNKAVDRMQQGFVNFMMLGRAMIHQDGFSDNPAFQLDEEAGPGEDLKSAIDMSQGSATRLQYMGISQGGIMGGALMALTPDADYGVLGVPGMNYSALLRRSVDSDTYFKNPTIGLYKFYPNYRERPLILALMQLLWDRGEANGYAEAMTSNPLPNTPPHNVLMRVAFGDHQVANVTAETELRTIGGSMYSPALNPGRHWEATPFSGMNLASSFPFNNGSMMVYYDSGPPSFNGTNGQGIATPPNENVPPRKEWGYGGDPHEHPRRSPDGIRHAATFLQNGTIESCEVTTPSPGDAHCYANGWTGPTP